MKENNIPTFVKWAGGKRQLIPQLKLLFPDKIKKYFDPFVGGGAVAFFIMQNYNPKKVIISDINEDLINCYNVIRDNTEDLIRILKRYKNNHNKEFYYKMRKKSPGSLSNIYRAARFIYLNKTCFNGLCRVNSEGNFNVPIGNYKNPILFREKELNIVSELLENTIIKTISFEDVLGFARKGDFIYFDPPYYPLKKGRNFTKYTRNDFLEKDHIKLASVFRELDRRGCLVMLSNSNDNFIRDLYENFNKYVITANRTINCNSDGRSGIKEIIVTNYKPKISGL